MSPAAFAAVDLGASHGRVMVGRLDGPDRLDLTEVSRFDNRPVTVAGTLYWDILALYRGVLDGLRAAGPVDAIGIDGWGVDYGLLDADGTLLANPVHHRDSRTGPAMAAVHARLPAAEQYAATGIAALPINTVYQLAADPRAAGADRILLLPDLIAYWLTGVAGTERTNASTTALLDPATGAWSAGTAARAGVDVGRFAPLRSPGDPAGVLNPEACAATGLPPVPVYAVASHDTASAVAAVPAGGDGFAYLSSGTWSLVGVELDAPVRTEDARRAAFTNELGVDGTIRFLRNVTGLWLLQECQRVWNLPDVGPLLRRAEDVPAGPVVDANDPRFLPPGDMPARIAAACRDTGQPVPATPAGITRCVLDSLAAAYADAVRTASRLSGRRVEAVHVVGGGSRNEPLCRLTAAACGLPVVAGPVEATALGNVLVAARGHGTFHGGLSDMRALVRHTQELRTYLP